MVLIGTAHLSKNNSGGHIVNVQPVYQSTVELVIHPQLIHPELVFDDPHSYDNIPVQYSSSGPTGGW